MFELRKVFRVDSDGFDMTIDGLPVTLLDVSPISARFSTQNKTYKPQPKGACSITLNYVKIAVKYEYYTDRNQDHVILFNFDNSASEASLFKVLKQLVQKK